MRDLDENPYSADEARIAKFFWDKGLGGGDDPVGFILASYEYLVHERNELRQQETSGIYRRLLKRAIDSSPFRNRRAPSRS